MNKQEFHDMYCISEEMAERLYRMVEYERQQAITEHEASQWKPYPENLPDWDKKYWAHNTFGHESGCYGREFDAICVIAFRELPKPYQEGKPAKFNDTTSEPFDCNEFEIHVNTKWEGGEK